MLVSQSATDDLQTCFMSHVCAEAWWGASLPVGIQPHPSSSFSKLAHNHLTFIDNKHECMARCIDQRRRRLHRSSSAMNSLPPRGCCHAGNRLSWFGALPRWRTNGFRTVPAQVTAQPNQQQATSDTSHFIYCCLLMSKKCEGCTIMKPASLQHRQGTSQCYKYLLFTDHACLVTLQNRYVHLHTISKVHAHLAGSRWEASRRC